MNKQIADEYCKLIERITFEQIRSISIDSERLNTFEKQFSGEVMLL